MPALGCGAFPFAPHCWYRRGIGELLEISDVIVDFDEETLLQRPVRRTEAVARLSRSGQRSAARYVERLPARDGVLDADTCNAILVRSHIELQRLNEEFLQVERVRSVLVPVLQALRDHGVPAPYRVVDIGCGIGYLVRALAAQGRLGRDVDLIGCDMNLALLTHARALAAEESLSCKFLAANAFRLAQPAHVFISTGVLHHARGVDLDAFFAGQRAAWAFLHYDMQASWLSPIGSWLFHRARMREPLARHDGVVSAMRAHGSRTLVTAARENTSFTCAPVDGGRSFASVILRPMHAVVGTRPEVWSRFLDRLGPLRARLAE